MIRRERDEVLGQGRKGRALSDRTDGGVNGSDDDYLERFFFKEGSGGTRIFFSHSSLHNFRSISCGYPVSPPERADFDKSAASVSHGRAIYELGITPINI